MDALGLVPEARQLVTITRGRARRPATVQAPGPGEARRAQGGDPGRQALSTSGCGAGSPSAGHASTAGDRASSRSGNVVVCFPGVGPATGPGKREKRT